MIRRSISKAVMTVLFTCTIVGLLLSAAMWYGAIGDERMQIERGWKRRCYQLRACAVLSTTVTVFLGLGAIFTHRLVIADATKS
jgi:hypothetical protein